MTLRLYVPNDQGGFRIDPLPFGVVIERRRDGYCYVRPRTVADLFHEGHEELLRKWRNAHGHPN